MLLNYRTILLGLSVASSVLCDSPSHSGHGALISHPSFTPKHDALSSTNLHPSSDTDITARPEDDEDTIASIDDAQHEKHPHSDTLMAAQAATISSTVFAPHTPTASLPDPWALVDDLDNEMFTPRFPATNGSFDRSTSSTTLLSSTTPSAVPSNDGLDPVKAALDWLTSTSNSTNYDGKSASAASKSSTSLTGPHSTTNASVATTDPAKAALDWLTSGVDDKSSIPPTPTDPRHSNTASGILSELETTHTSAAAADKLRMGFW